MDDDGLPNTRPIDRIDSPRCQRSQSSVFSAVLNPRRYLRSINQHSISPFKIKCRVAFFRPMPLSVPAAGIIAFLGIVASLGGMAMWNATLRTVGPNRATIFLNLVPVFGVSLAIIFLGERLFGHHLAGAGLVGLGIVLVVSGARQIAK